MSKRDAIKHILTHGVVDVIDRDNLEKRLLGRKKLRVKFGADPTSPELHVGNAIPLWKLKEFQDLGHTVVVIIGDATARIGDPSGKKKARPMMEEKEIKKNTRTWIKQVGKILDIQKIEIRQNSEWYDDMDLSDVIRLASNMTVARLIERDDFANRLRSGTEVYLHELLYPLMQAYDSIAVESDVEIGGTDQLFNILAGRELQKKFGMKAQDVITLPLLVGTDGKEKMSKSIGNVVTFSDDPSDMFGKIMAIPDTLISNYALLVAQYDEEEVRGVHTRLQQENPRDVKADIAEAIVSLYRSKNVAKRAREEFFKVFQKRQLPEKVSLLTIPYGTQPLVPLLHSTGLAKSASEARRLIEQGAVKINDQKHTDWNKPVNITKDTILKVGKRKFAKVA